MSGGNGRDRHIMMSDKTAGQYSINTRNSSMLLPPPTWRFPLAEVSKFTILKRKLSQLLNAREFPNKRLNQ